MHRIISRLSFTLLIILGMVITVGWAYTRPTTDPDRKIGDIRKDVFAFVKRSKTKDPDEKSAAIFDLCLLHKEIVADPRFQTDENMISFRAVVANRLKKCKRELVAAEKKAARERNRIAKRQNQQQAEEWLVDEESEYESDELLLASSMSEHLQLIGEVTGGPSQVFSYANGNFGPGSAEDLIELIETTISPETWRNNGGNGQLFFFQSACALVVTASSETHDRISDLLRQIRQ